MSVTCECGCAVRGVHIEDCDSAECLGCTSAPAAVGVLCERCWARLQSTVRTLPALVEQVVSGECGVQHGAVSSVPGPRVLYPRNVGDADELVGLLASWAEVEAEDEGGALPQFAGLWVSAPTRRVDQETGEAYFVESQVVGVRDPAGVRSLVRWLDARLERVASRGWAPLMLREVSREASRVRAIWQTVEPERRVREIACPACGAHSLVVVPPSVEGADEQVTCSRTSCGKVLSSQDWELLRAWALVVARMGEQA